MFKIKFIIVSFILFISNVCYSGAIGGPRIANKKILPNQTHLYEIDFNRNDYFGEIIIAGSGKSDLDCYVFNELDELVAKDTNEKDLCELKFPTFKKERFKIFVKNLGKENKYFLKTN